MMASGLGRTQLLVPNRSQGQSSVCLSSKPASAMHIRKTVRRRPLHDQMRCRAKNRGLMQCAGSQDPAYSTKLTGSPTT